MSVSEAHFRPPDNDDATPNQSGRVNWSARLLDSLDSLVFALNKDKNIVIIQRISLSHREEPLLAN